MLQSKFRCPSTQVKRRGSIVDLPVILCWGSTDGQEDPWSSLGRKSSVISKL